MKGSSSRDSHVGQSSKEVAVLFCGQVWKENCCVLHSASVGGVEMVSMLVGVVLAVEVARERDDEVLYVLMIMCVCVRLTESMVRGIC